jgi:hypothetical protein
MAMFGALSVLSRMAPDRYFGHEARLVSTAIGKSDLIIVGHGCQIVRVGFRVGHHGRVAVGPHPSRTIHLEFLVSCERGSFTWTAVREYLVG